MANNFKEMTKEEISIRARELINDPVLLEVFDQVEKQAWADFRNSQPDGINNREASYSLLMAAETLKQKLHSMAITPRVDAVNARARAKPMLTVPNNLRDKHN